MERRSGPRPGGGGPVASADVGVVGSKVFEHALEQEFSLPDTPAAVPGNLGRRGHAPVVRPHQLPRSVGPCCPAPGAERRVEHEGGKIIETSVRIGRRPTVQLPLHRKYPPVRLDQDRPPHAGPGSLVMRSSRCGHAGCAFRAVPPRLHSPNPVWTHRTNATPSRSTPRCDARPERVDTSPTSKPHSSASTWSCLTSTHRPRKKALDEPMEARTQRLRDHLRKPPSLRRPATTRWPGAPKS